MISWIKGLFGGFDVGKSLVVAMLVPGKKARKLLETLNKKP